MEDFGTSVTIEQFAFLATHDARLVDGVLILAFETKPISLWHSLHLGLEAVHVIAFVA